MNRGTDAAASADRGADAGARRRRGGAGAGLVVLAVAAPLVLSACSGTTAGGSNSSAVGGQRGVANAPAAGPQQYAAGGGAAGSSANGGVSSAAPGSGTNVAVQSNRDLVITAGIQVKTGDAAVAAQRAQIVAEGVGGYVAGESIGPGSQNMPSSSPSTVPEGSSDGSSGAGGAQSPATLPDVTGSSSSTQALLVLRVPPQSVDSVVSSLASQGSVTYQSRSATDVTGQVADVASRVSSAQASIAELRTLIDKAASMNDLISLEQALAQRESDLESLEAQQRALSDQVQYATITVGYFSQGAPVVPPPVHTGFTRGLTAGWHGFLAVVRGILAAVGWLLPYLAVIIVFWWPVRRLARVWRRNRARRGPQTPTPTPAAPSEN